MLSKEEDITARNNNEINEMSGKEMFAHRMASAAAAKRPDAPAIVSAQGRLAVTEATRAGTALPR